jgi:hypothetical protein
MRIIAVCLGSTFLFWLQTGSAQIVTNLGQGGSFGAGGNPAPRTLTLTRTVAAPYGAEGSVTLQSSNSPAGAQLVIEIEAQGLTPGKYRLEYAEVPSGRWSELGFITITDPDATPDLEAGASRHEDSSAHAAEGIKSRIAIAAPAGVPPGRIRYIRFTDLGGTVLLENQAR